MYIIRLVLSIIKKAHIASWLCEQCWKYTDTAFWYKDDSLESMCLKCGHKEHVPLKKRPFQIDQLNEWF